MCSNTMALAAAQRKYDELHEAKPFHDGTFKVWAEKRSDRTPFHYLDGVRIWVSAHDLTPDDDFLNDPPNQPQDGGDAA